MTDDEITESQDKIKSIKAKILDADNIKEVNRLREELRRETAKLEQLQ